MEPVVVIAAYRFVELADPADWQRRVRERAEALGLRGTVLLATEGINLGLAGTPVAVERFKGWLCGHAEFADMPVKTSRAGAVPFGRLRVKVKPEIIRMNRPTVRPQRRRAPAVAAQTLARWLDAGRDDAGRALALLDTRNAFEVGHGSFRGALDWQLEKFSDFPHALQARRRELRDKTVVSFCTGGIRCEKAALLMEDEGVENVLQLDGGILKYFEVAGAAHFDGHCFVFDQREFVDAALNPLEPELT